MATIGFSDAASTPNPLIAREKAMPAMRRKGDLPQKPCAHCARPMVWRKRWEKVWDEVRYCSDRCRDEARRQRKPPAAS